MGRDRKLHDGIVGALRARCSDCRRVLVCAAMVAGLMRMKITPFHCGIIRDLVNSDAKVLKWHAASAVIVPSFLRAVKNRTFNIMAGGRFVR